MISISFELQRLEQSLFDHTGEYTQTQARIDDLRMSIDNAIAGIVEQSLSYAIDFAEELKAYDFATLVDVRELYEGMYEITTINGQTDFSVPEIKMLPHLLRNGKTSKEGNVYKVVPIEDESPAKPRHMSVFDVLRDRQTALTKKRDMLNADSHSRLSSHMSNLSAGIRTPRSEPQHSPKQRSGQVHFVTASSKQDPNNSWVIPEQDKDMTDFLINTNIELSSNIEHIVTEELNNFKRTEGII